MTDLRTVLRRVPAQAASDGAGVRLARTFPTPALDHLDPFLLLDEFRSDDPDDWLAGFPDHPHRGFETVTYLIAGAMRHRDRAGHEGVVRAGGVQWMTAGRGIVHSEMPEQVDGLLQGFQLWVNLPAAEKMKPPAYQELEPDEVPVVERDGASVRVVAGERDGVPGAVRGIAVDPLYLDVELAAGARFEHGLPEGHAAFLYPFDGAVRVGGERVPASTLAVLGPGPRVAVDPDGDARFLLVAGRPIGEPIARHGPFVMNTRDEIVQAVRDFQAGRMG